ncbi:MAG: metallophosphoesterase [Ignavibacteriaceae bacterium]|nr:metallophosphoesterase [Ignavibacteriaceae bacterium]
MALFFIIFFLVYGSANFYVFLRGFQALEATPVYVKIFYSAVFILGASGYVLARVLDWENWIYDLLHFWGALWFAILLYAFMAVFLIDIVRLIDKFFPFVPYKLFSTIQYFKLAVFGLVSLYLLIVVGYGMYNANNIQIKTMNITLPKKGSNLTELDVAFLSDTHFSPITGYDKAEQIHQLLEGIKPDLILMGGDIIDDKAHHLIRHDIDKKLKEIKAPLGVITINGNHEFINGYVESIDFIQRTGIKLLADSLMVIDNNLVIVGREDLSINRFANKKRKELTELMAPANALNLPVILLDHQPFNLEQAEQTGVDFQLSGHTHNGQLFPANLVVQRIYEMAWATSRKGKLSIMCHPAQAHGDLP